MDTVRMWLCTGIKNKADEKMFTLNEIYISDDQGFCITDNKGQSQLGEYMSVGQITDYYQIDFIQISPYLSCPICGHQMYIVNKQGHMKKRIYCDMCKKAKNKYICYTWDDINQGYKWYDASIYTYRTIFLYLIDGSIFEGK